MKEIGSEFWIDHRFTEQNSNLFEELINFGDDRQLLFSGRTAIDYVLDDIQKPINCVYMPSYCCISMLQPFIDRNISIEFYEVIADESGINYYIDFEKNVDIFFATCYFGYQDTAMDDIIGKFKLRNTIVIEDITHRLLCEKNFSEKADYIIASLRKWFAIPSGGLAVKQSGKFKEMLLSSPPKNILNKKISAMEKKAIYMEESETNTIDKNEFLNLYSEFNKYLQNNYRRIRIDEYSLKILNTLDISLIKKKRRENISYIYENLQLTDDFSFLINEFNYNKDCLLFIPLIVDKRIREDLKQYLISNSIYTPVHWPLPKLPQLKKYSTELYEKELSLVCDQRYGLSDMQRIVSMIGEFKDWL